MNKPLLVSFLAIVVIQATGKTLNASPRDLLGDAVAQLANLESIVTTDILWAHEILEELVQTFTINSASMLQDGQRILNDEHQSIVGQITALIELATSAGHDVSSCIESQGLILDALPGNYTIDIENCIQDINDLARTNIGSSTYLIDININVVHDLQFQLGRCVEDPVCINAIISQTQIYMVTLPEGIELEVNAAGQVIENLNLAAKGCADNNIAGYKATATAILSEVENCVNLIINGS